VCRSVVRLLQVCACDEIFPLGEALMFSLVFIVYNKDAFFFFETELGLL